MGTRKGWRKSEVLNWLEARAKMRDCKEGKFQEDPRLMKMTEVEELTGLARSQIYLLMEAGAFPEGVTLTRHRKAWLAGEVETFIKHREAKRGKKRVEAEKMVSA